MKQILLEKEESDKQYYEDYIRDMEDDWNINYDKEHGNNNLDETKVIDYPKDEKYLFTINTI